jgi:2-isopropylmalate synthase
MIADSVAFLAGEGKRVVYDAEHFFDAWRDDPEYALECLRAAAGAGAEFVTLCDTNGATLPHDVAAATAAVVAALDVAVAIHAHDDAGCGVANSLAAVRPAPRWSRGRSTATGERCGNANLTTILPNVELKLGVECLGRDRLRHLTATAHYVDELLNFTPDPDQPYVGSNALRAQGRDARRRRQRRPGDLRARRPGRGRQRPRAARLRAGRQGHRALARRPARASSSTTRPPRG